MDGQMSTRIGDIRLVDDFVTHVSASRTGVEVLTEARLTYDPISARNYAALLVRASDETERMRARNNDAVIGSHVVGIRVDHDSVKRGGTCRVAVCVCGWFGPQRSSLEIAVDDAHAHEGRWS
jgi:hypothetical protein